MYSASVTVTNPIGLHARPASRVAQAAAAFSSSVWINKEGAAEKFNAKSITAILRMGASAGTDLNISAEGADEAVACETLRELIQHGLNEP